MIFVNTTVVLWNHSVFPCLIVIGDIQNNLSDHFPYILACKY